MPGQESVATNDKSGGAIEGRPQRQWCIRPGDPVAEQTLMRECGVTPLQARLLLNRGVRTPAEAREFMNPAAAQILSPFLFQHMEKAVARVRHAIDRKEKIFIFGDRDVDGVGGTAILRIILTALGATVDSHIPAGGEGYGVHPDTLARAIREGFTLGITVDTGIAELERVAEAKAAGMDIIIADHHQQKPALPRAFAILHPGIAGEPYPFKYLSGAGVAFKLAMALIESRATAPYANRPVVFVDVETTGLNPGADEIIEIGAVKYRNGVKLSEFSRLIKLDRPLPEEIQKITGITDQELAANGAGRRATLAGFREFISEPDTLLCGYRFDFDRGFLTAEFKRHLDADLNHPTMDIMAASAAGIPGLISRSLAGVAGELGVAVTTRHRALPDAQTTALVFYEMRSRADHERRLFYERLIPLAALAAVADVMPLTGENRAIVAEGMKILRDNPPLGLKCLLERLDLAAPTGRDLAFSLGPLLNAPGRMGDATPALKLLTTASKQEAVELSEDIIRLNTERKELGKDNFRRLMELVPIQNDLANDRIICIHAEGIPHGVTGIVAGRIKEALGRPVMIILVEDGKGVGTARSVESLNLFDAVNDCADLLEKFGGHHQAVGVTANPAQIPALFERLKKSVTARLQADSTPESVIDVDAEMWTEHLTMEILDQTAALEPFGKGNPFPKFAIFNAPVVDVRRIGDEGQHLRLRIGDSPQQAVTAVGWGMGGRADRIQSRIDAVFELTRNVWNGRVDLQIVLEDFRTPS